MDLRVDQRLPARLAAIFDYLAMMQGRVAGEEAGLEVEFLACHSVCRVPGLGTALVSRALTAAAARGVRTVRAHASSHFSARIFSRLGFREVATQRFRDYTVDGKVVFPTADPHTHSKMFVKDLQ